MGVKPAAMVCGYLRFNYSEKGRQGVSGRIWADDSRPINHDVYTLRPLSRFPQVDSSCLLSRVHLHRRMIPGHGLRSSFVYSGEGGCMSNGIFKNEEGRLTLTSMMCMSSSSCSLLVIPTCTPRCGVDRLCDPMVERLIPVCPSDGSTFHGSDPVREMRLSEYRNT